MIRQYILPWFLLFFTLFGNAQTDQPKNLVVVISVADMYSSPNEDSDVVSQAIYASNAALLDERTNWVKIRTTDQYSGWVSLDKIRNVALPYASSGRVAQVSGVAANLYREADVTAHHPLLAVPFETRLEVIAEGKGDDAGWLQVRLPDLRMAWIEQGNVNLESHPLTIPESIALAHRFLGVTYTGGGTSSFGFDCSGFTQMLVRSRGIIMPRDADLQATWQGVIPVDRKHLHPGDLLFFGSAFDHITHTGMFIGHGQFIHDTTNEHPGVQISKLKDQPWTKVLVASRRIK